MLLLKHVHVAVKGVEKRLHSGSFHHMAKYGTIFFHLGSTCSAMRGQATIRLAENSRKWHVDRQILHHVVNAYMAPLGHEPSPQKSRRC
jgi:hypothetical protein